GLQRAIIQNKKIQQKPEFQKKRSFRKKDPPRIATHNGSQGVNPGETPHLLVGSPGQEQMSTVFFFRVPVFHSLLQPFLHELPSCRLFHLLDQLFPASQHVLHLITRKASSKSHRDRSVPGGSSLQHGNIAPKVEFSDHSIDPEERDAYWTARESNPFPPASDGLNTIIGLLCSGDFYWATFTPKRVRHAVALNRSRFQPDLPIEEEDEPSMDGFIPCEAPVERSRNRKSKHIVVDDDEVGGGCFPETLVGNYFDGELFDLEELLGSNPPEAEVGSDKGPEFTKASRLVNGASVEFIRFEV
ncbi:hypothetical protein HID58_066821, partial [Brassica napus]